MELVAFRVRNFRSIIDSGWIELDRLTVLVGKNQAGKTGLLRALHKFNPFSPDPYNMDREWPRGRRKERDPKAVVVETRFRLSPTERTALQKTAGVAVPDEVEILRRYDGARQYKFRDFDLKQEMSSGFARGLDDLEGTISAKCSAEARTDMKSVTDILRKLASAADFGAIKTTIAQATQRVSGDAQPPIRNTDAAERQLLRDSLGRCLASVPADLPTQAIEKQLEGWIPTFVYMDDYLTYSGSTFLNQMKERVDAGKPTEEDKTIETLMDMAGLDLDQQVKMAGENDREQRMLDLNDASLTLTKEMEGRWSQEDYVVQFQADQYHFMTFVRKPGQTALVPIEEESRGFQWFFSFDLHFAHETRGTLRGAVLLLDEPGLHLHPTAQRDLLRRLEAYAKENSVIFSTHLPFMIDLNRPERIKIVDVRPTGTVVTDDIFAAKDADARFTLQSALGMSASQSLLVAPYNLVVEGADDFWFISAMSEMLRSAGRTSLDARVKVTPSFGAPEAAYMAAFMCGQDLDVVALFDSDDAGDAAEELLVKRWMTKYKDRAIAIARIGAAIEAAPGQPTIEDLFDPQLYSECVQEAYRRELEGKALDLPAADGRRILDRVSEALGRHGVGKFNKGRVSKLLYKRIRESTVDTFSKRTLSSFEKLFELLNSHVAAWDAKTTTSRMDVLPEPIVLPLRDGKPVAKA